jgi:hypothetical protein
MTRISSQKVRQAVLVTGDPLDPNTLPEKIMLFNELGDPLMLGGGFARRDIDDVSGLLNPTQVEARTVTLYPSVRLYKIKTDRPARVRLYPTAVMRDVDISRSIGVAPRGNHGRLLEVVTANPDLLELVLSPAVDITSADAFNSDFYVSVTNLDSVSGPVVVTYSFFRTE